MPRTLADGVCLVCRLDDATGQARRYAASGYSVNTEQSNGVLVFLGHLWRLQSTVIAARCTRCRLARRIEDATAAVIRGDLAIFQRLTILAHLWRRAVMSDAKKYR
jgi:hypothetical protein